MIDRLLVELTRKTRSLVIDEHDIALKLAERGQELAANKIRHLIPFRDRQNRVRACVQCSPSNSVGGDDWQQPVPPPDLGQVVLDHRGADDRAQQPPRRALVNSGNRVGKGARQHGEQ